MKPLFASQSLRLRFHRAIRAALVATVLFAAPLSLPSLSQAQNGGWSQGGGLLDPAAESLQKQISELEANLCAESPQSPARVPTVDPIQSQMEATTGCLDCATEQVLAQTRPQGVLDQVGELLVPVDEALKKERIQNEVEFLKYYLNLTRGKALSLPTSEAELQQKVNVAKMQLENIEASIKHSSDNAKQMHEQKQRSMAQISAIEKLESGRALDAEEKHRLGDFDLIKQSFMSSTQLLPQYELMYDEMIKHPFTSTSDSEEVKRTIERLKKKAELQAALESEWGTLETWAKGQEGVPPPSKLMRDTLKTEIKKIIESHEDSLTSVKASLKSLNSQAEVTRAKLKELEKRLADEKKKQETEDTGSTANMMLEEELAKLEEYFKDRATQSSGNPNVPDCGMSIAEKLALSHYSGNGYGRLNSALREGGKKKEKLEPFAKVLDAALKKLRPYEGIAIRGGDLPGDLLEKHQTEAIVTYQAFTSSSVASGFSSNHRFTILSKSGRYIAPFAQVFHEYEVLFPANTRFKVLAREEKYPGQIHFVLEEVLENEE